MFLILVNLPCFLSTASLYIPFTIQYIRIPSTISVYNEFYSALKEVPHVSYLRRVQPLHIMLNTWHTFASLQKQCSLL